MNQREQNDDFHVGQRFYDIDASDPLWEVMKVRPDDLIFNKKSWEDASRPLGKQTVRALLKKGFWVEVDDPL